MVLVIYLVPKGTTMHNLTIDKNWVVAVVLPFSKSVGKSQNRKCVGKSQNSVYRKFVTIFLFLKIARSLNFFGKFDWSMNSRRRRAGEY